MMGVRDTLGRQSFEDAAGDEAGWVCERVCGWRVLGEKDGARQASCRICRGSGRTLADASSVGYSSFMYATHIHTHEPWTSLPSSARHVGQRAGNGPAAKRDWR